MAFAVLSADSLPDSDVVSTLWGPHGLQVWTLHI